MDVMKAVETMPGARSKDARICVDNYRKWHKGQITKDEFLLENAYIAYNYGLDDFKCVDRKIITPSDLQCVRDDLEKYAKGITTKKPVIDEEFWEQSHIKKYIEDRYKIKQKNIGNYIWLYKLQQIFSKAKDTERESGVYSVMCTYDMKFRTDIKWKEPYEFGMKLITCPSCRKKNLMEQDVKKHHCSECNQELVGES